VGAPSVVTTAGTAVEAGWSAVELICWQLLTKQTTPSNAATNKLVIATMKLGRGEKELAGGLFTRDTRCLNPRLEADGIASFVHMYVSISIIIYKQKAHVLV
jgi:hypothetical protein